MKRRRSLLVFSSILVLGLFFLFSDNSFQCAHSFESFANTIYDSDDMWVEKELFEENLEG